MAHALVMGLFARQGAAADAARALRSLGIARERVSIVARSHDEEVDLAKASEASPGVEIEDSPVAFRLGELGAHVLDSVRVVPEAALKAGFQFKFPNLDGALIDVT